MARSQKAAIQRQIAVENCSQGPTRPRLAGGRAGPESRQHPAVNRLVAPRSARNRDTPTPRSMTIVCHALGRKRLDP